MEKTAGEAPEKVEEAQEKVEEKKRGTEEMMCDLSSLTVGDQNQILLSSGQTERSGGDRWMNSIH